jgi:hypothetical protein
MRGRNDEDWLSCTIRRVEAVMVEHGFVDEREQAPQPPNPPASRKRRGWIRLLVSIFRMQEMGVHLPTKLTPSGSALARKEYGEARHCASRIM